METVGASLEELPWFVAYLATAAVLTLVYAVVYTWVTPHPEIKLIRENNLAASLAFAGSLVGFSLPLASAIANSGALVDTVIWGLIAIVVQIGRSDAGRHSQDKLNKRIHEVARVVSEVGLEARRM